MGRGREGEEGVGGLFIWLRGGSRGWGVGGGREGSWGQSGSLQGEKTCETRER